MLRFVPLNTGIVGIKPLGQTQTLWRTNVRRQSPWWCTFLPSGRLDAGRSLRVLDQRPEHTSSFPPGLLVVFHRTSSLVLPRSLSRGDHCCRRRVHFGRHRTLVRGHHLWPPSLATICFCSPRLSAAPAVCCCRCRCCYNSCWFCIDRFASIFIIVPSAHQQGGLT